MKFTETELRKMRDRIAALESEADEADERAAEALEEMRDEGINPLTDSDAFETLTELEREAGEARDEAADLRKRYETAAKDRKADAGKTRKRKRSALELDDVERETAKRLGIGSRFTESDTYKRMTDALSRGHDLQDVVSRASAVEVATRTEAAGLLTRDVDAAALVDNDKKGELASHIYRPNRVLNLITVGETDSDTVEYVSEDAPTENVEEVPYATDAASTGTLPESTYGFSESTVSTHRIGHHVPATEKQLADAAGLSTTLNTRLRGGVRRKLENLIVNGDASGSDAWDGILNAGNIASYARDTANSESRHDAVLKAKTKVRVNTEGETEPSVIGFHPNDWEDFVLEKDADGNYLNMRGVNEPSTVWGMRPVISSVFPEGTNLVGDYSGAFLWLRSGISVVSSDSHSDWFLKGWIAMKAQVRAAFATVLGRNFCAITSA